MVALSACGRVSFTPLSDAANDGAAFTADFDVPFGAVALVTAFNDPAADEDDVSLTGDMLEAYFMSTRSGSELLYRSTRVDLSSAWSTPTQVPELASGGLNNPRVREDGLQIVFTSSRAMSQAEDIWIADRIDRTAPWNAPQRVVEVSTASDEFEPFVTASGRELYYLSRVGAESDIFVATRPGATEPFGPRVALTSLNSPLYEGGTWLDASQQYIWFHSNRDGETNIFRAR